MPTYFVDYENGDNNFAGTSFNVLASGTNGRISTNTFSSSTASFSNNGTLCSINNLLGASERLYDTLHWTPAFTTVTTVNITPPSGVVGNVHSVIETTANNTHTLQVGANLYSTTISTQYTISLYAKAAGRNIMTVRFNISGDTTTTIRYNLSSGTIAQSGSSASGTITSIGDGWYRLTLTANASVTNQRIIIGLANDSYTGLDMQSYQGDGVSGIYLAGLQLQIGGSATTYEKSPEQYLSIFNGSIYAVYEIVQYLSSTSLFIVPINNGTALANQTVDRQYYIGGRWRDLTNGATAVRMIEGTTTRIMGSPDPTPIGSGTWVGQRSPASVTISSSTNASPISINCASTMSSLGISTGDTVQIVGHTTNTNANGTWEVTVPSPGGTSFTLNGSTGNGVGGATGRFRKKTSSVIRLPSALTANIASFGNRGEGRTAWVASTNVTTTLLDTDTHEGDVSDSIAVGASFVTGKAAYKATGTLNLSGYQQISFWIKQTAGTVTVNGDISLRLCSDTIGDTVVHTFNIDGLVLLNQWTCMVINLGSNMNSSIQSVALYVDVDRGAQTFLLSNIIACKAASSDDSLNLCSLISKNTTDEPWLPLMSINGTRVMLGNHTNLTPIVSNNLDTNTERGYIGTSETVLTYKRETIKSLVASATNQTGTATNRVKYEFGWDRTNMTTQNLVTYLDGRNCNLTGLSTNGINYIDVNRVGLVRYSTGFAPWNIIYNTYNLEWIIGCSSNGMTTVNTNLSTFNTMNVTCCAGNPINIVLGTNIITFNKMIAVNNIVNASSINFGQGCDNITINNIKVANSGAQGVALATSTNILINGGSITDNINQGVIVQGVGNSKIKNIYLTNNSQGIAISNNNDFIIENCLIDQTVEVFVNTYTNGRGHLINNDNVVGNNFTVTDGGIITPQTSVRYTNSGFAWSLSPSSTIRDSNYPLALKVATVAVSANSLVTVKAWMRRTNTGLTTGLRIKGGQIAGISNDITSYMTAAANIWEQITLTFTPTEIGVVEIFAECYGGSTFTGYIDDISITQV